jgi:hypothetical protein
MLLIILLIILIILFVAGGFTLSGWLWIAAIVALVCLVVYAIRR